jgi:hypothetical protein
LRRPEWREKVIIDGNGIKAVSVGPFRRGSGFGEIPGRQEKTEFDFVH